MGRRSMVIIRGGFDPRASTVSLDFNGTNENLAKSAVEVDVGIANSFSILAWAYTVDLTAARRVLHIRAPGSLNNNVIIDLQGTIANDPVQFRIFNSAGTEIKDYRYNSRLPASTWTAMLFTWDGTTLTGYFNGTAQTADTKTVDTTGTMTQIDRDVYIGTTNVGTQYWSGYIHSVAMWNTALSAAQAATVSAAGANLGAIDGKDNLVHWWRLGLPAINGMAGSTYVCDAVASGGIDVAVDATNMSDADIVSSAPA